MRFISSKTKSPTMKAWGKKEWAISDKKHFGTLDFDFEERHTYIRAQEGKEILGIIHIKTQGGVAEVVSFIVGHAHQRQGVGRQLMERAEKRAKEQNCHKMILITGEDWDARKFYESVGFEHSGDLLRHFLNRNFVEYTKFI